MNKIKVLIVDDSALVRRMLQDILGGAPDLEVVGTAGDPLIARDKIKRLNPDVITLDVEMPRMDGLTFLANLMRLRPTPVVMISTLTEAGADVTLRALELGAVDFVPKPKLGVAQGLEQLAEEIRGKVRIAARARLAPKTPRPAPRALEVPPKLSADAVLEKRTLGRHFRTADRLVAIGASTGGTEAIKDVLLDMPASGPIVVISQHIPEAFSRSFARRLDELCAMRVAEAADGQLLLPGHAYVAPGNRHLIVARDGARYVARLSDGPPVNRHRPSVDVMFRSVAQSAGPNAVGVLLTGMGDDGARGLLEMREAGAHTIAQDEATSVVWGMPGEAVKRGAAELVLPLREVARRVLSLAQAEGPPRPAPGPLPSRGRPGLSAPLGPRSGSGQPLG